MLNEYQYAKEYQNQADISEQSLDLDIVHVEGEGEEERRETAAEEKKRLE